MSRLSFHHLVQCIAQPNVLLVLYHSHHALAATTRSESATVRDLLVEFGVESVFDLIDQLQHDRGGEEQLAVYSSSCGPRATVSLNVELFRLIEKDQAF